MCLTKYRHPQDRVDAQTSKPEAVEHMLERHRMSMSGEIVFLWQCSAEGRKVSLKVNNKKKVATLLSLCRVYRRNNKKQVAHVN